MIRIKKNIGTMGRIGRAALGIAVIGLGIYNHNWLGLIGLFLCMKRSPAGVSSINYSDGTRARCNDD